MKKLLVVFLVVIIVAAIVWFVTTTHKGEGEHLVLTGSAALAPVMKEITARFETQHPDVHIDVQAGGSGRGLADVRGGLADIGMVSGRPDARGGRLHWFPVARDGLAFIVHRDNPIAGLSKQNVSDIYTGSITRWDALGGPGLPITPVSREEGRAPLTALLAYTGLDNGAIKAKIIAGQSGRVVSAVAQNPGAVGYLSLSAALDAVGRGEPVRLVSLGGVKADTEDIGNGSYPVIITHSLVTRAPPRGLARRLIDFATARGNADLIRAADMIPAEK